MHAESVEYQHRGRRYVGHLALPEGDDRRAAVLVCHEGPGLDENAKQRAERLAALGYVAFALDYHGDGQPVDMAEVRARLGPMMTDPELTRGIGGAGLDVLLGHRRTDPARVAAIGFCFGGTMALELARGGADLRAVVGFHSGLSTARPQDAANIIGVVLVCIGADDPMIPPDQRAAFEDEMRAADVDWRMNVYGRAVHSFTNQRADDLGFPGIAYHGPTDARSWRAMLDLFDEVLTS
jgi:dienelactone hydrolase